MSVTPRRPLAVQPHPYIGDVVGRPLDRGMIYFGEPDKDPQDYPITVYLDPEQTKPAHQPIRTKGGFINVFGDITEIFADEILYSLKVLDCYGRLVFYKKRMHRDNITEELGGEIVRAQKAESALQSSIGDETTRAKKAESDLNANIIKEVSDRKLEVTRLDKADAVLQAQINSVGGGKLAYKTYAEMIADKSNIATNSSIDIIADTDDKNGTYLYDGTNFVKSNYDLENIIRSKVQNTFGTYNEMVEKGGALKDGSYALVADDTDDKNGIYIKEAGEWSKSKYNPVVQAKEFSKNTVTTVAPKIQNHGYYTGDSSTTVISGISTAFGFEALQSGKISGFKTQLAGGAATLSFQVYRPLHKNLELISTQDISVAYPDSTVNFSNPIEVEKGDIVALRYLSGSYVRGLVVGVGEPLGSYTVTAGTNVGEIVTFSRSRNKPEFTFDVIYSELTNKTTDTSLLDLLALNAGELKDKSLSVSGEFFTDTTTSGLITYAYGAPKAVATFSQLEQIKYKARVTSTNAKFTLAIIIKQNDSFVVSELIPVSAPADAGGIVIATKDHFGEVFVPSGGHVMVLGATTSDAVLGKTGNTAGWYYVAAASLDVGANVSVLFSTSNPITLEIAFSAIENNLEDRVATLENNTLNPTPLRHSKTLIKEQFLGDVLPSDWSETGGWTVNNGLKSPAIGGWTTTAVQANASAMAKRVYRCKFLVTDAASVFGLCTAPIEASSGSAVAMIDGLQNKLIIYLWDGTNAGTSVAEVTIPTLVANRNYYLQVEKNGYYSTVTLTDTITQQVTTLDYSATAPYVQFHGQGGVIFISGDVTAKFFSFNALYPEKPHSIIVGDSNSERAANVLANETWAFKYADMRSMNADVIVAGRSGDETQNFLKRKNFDLLEWRPKYVVWALGTNDTSQATWRTNMTQNIADTVALGAEPILVTQIPRTNSQALRTAMNDDIRNGYFGNYRYIDFARAVSLNHDGVTWDESYNSGDGTHVNPAGQAKMLAQALIDIPDLLY